MRATIPKDRKHTGHIRNSNFGLNLRTAFVHSCQLFTALTVKPSHHNRATRSWKTYCRRVPRQCLLSLFSSWPLHRLFRNSSAPSSETVAHLPSSCFSFFLTVCYGVLLLLCIPSCPLSLTTQTFRTTLSNHCSK